MTAKRIVACLVMAGALVHAQSTDPGVRPGSPGAGGALPGISSLIRHLFDFVTGEFAQLHSVAGAVNGEDGNGLGPTFNLNGCGGCHSQPTLGGSSPRLNPQVAVANLDGAVNTIPSFITLDGPVREVRFVRKPNGTPDGGVHGLFTIQGRFDAPSCVIPQPNFAQELANNNVIFRIPTPMFGAGLIENISDETILANKTASAALKAPAGIAGHENRTGNDGTITRFGWKAQNKSLAVFSGEAYNVEMGVTNELFQTERGMVQGCNFNTLPEDHLVYEKHSTEGGVSSGAQNFATFMRLLAAPAPIPDTVSIARGRNAFASIGCALCHTPSMMTEASDIEALSHKAANLYSDLLVHNMGVGLADGIQQGDAGPAEFRTAPLWGLGQRIFFLHVGRTKDLKAAIAAHSSPGSEANATVSGFISLTPPQQQDLLNFLRSL